MNDGSKLYISKNKKLIVKLFYVDMEEALLFYQIYYMNYINPYNRTIPKWHKYVDEIWTQDNISLETFFKKGCEINKEIKLRIKLYSSFIYHLVGDGDYIGKVVYNKDNQFNQEVLKKSPTVVRKEDMEKYFEPFIIDDYIEDSFKY